MNEGRRERAASGPRRGPMFRCSSTEKAVPAKIVHVEHFPFMQKSRPPTDLDPKESKQIFPDTAPQQKTQAHTTEQTAGRTSQTIFKIHSYGPRIYVFPDFLFVTDPPSTPRA